MAIDERKRAEELYAECVRLRGILRRCVRGTDVVELGGGEIISLHLPNKPLYVENRGH